MSGSRFPVVSKERRTVDGITFASGREAKEYATLKLRERIGEISDLKLQPAFPVEIGGKPFCIYRADFEYTENGKRVIVDKKSSGTAKDPAYRIRRKAAELFYGIKITET